eukprot:TRINITY_DN17164_c0_g1_i2.p1 TRINITY_DN17164_c0_g1~~TRINITY_DN17164_c0_g1_i2.p1  ORF type:complete len:835 (+),score=291.76 TRINITY_DN17164_c0_g1_i2:83-2506(+)
MPLAELLAKRTRENWLRTLEGSSDTASVVLYDATQVLAVLLGDRPIDPGLSHSLDSIASLFSLALSDAPHRFPEAADAAASTFASFLRFLVRCHNTRPTPLLREVENRVVTLLYNSAGCRDLCTADDATAAFAPFLLHAAYVQLRQLHGGGARVFGCPPRELPVERRLHVCDQYLWLVSAMLPLITPSCFRQLLAHRPEDAEFQVLYVIEVLELSQWHLLRMLEECFAVPLRIPRPSAHTGAAEPKVLPQRMLAFLRLDNAGTDADTVPPGEWFVEQSGGAPANAEAGAASESWTFQCERNEEHSRVLQQRLEVLASAAPLPASLIVAEQERGGGVAARVCGRRVDFVCGCMHWVLTSVFAYLHTIVGGTPPPEASALVSLWHEAALQLELCIADTMQLADRIPPAHFDALLIELLRGCLRVVMVENAFEAFHPQGALRSAPPRPRPSGTSGAPGQLAKALCLTPLLSLLQKASVAGRFAAFSSVAPGTRVPALEHCVISFLHDTYLLQLEFSNVCCKAEPQRRSTAAVPVQNAFRGMHAVLAELADSPGCAAELASTGAGEGLTLRANWLKAVEVAKCFAALPDGLSVSSPAEVNAERATAISRSAWALVHYFFQQTQPSAPTAPPAPVTEALRRTGDARSWDDYEQYFAQMTGATAAETISDLPLDFALTGPAEATVAYRLSRLLSSHLRGICQVMPYFRLLFVACRRGGVLGQCAYYCASLADLIEHSSHNHGVAVPFLLAALRCYEAEGSHGQAVSTAQRLDRILRVLQELPCAALLQKHTQQLTEQYCQQLGKQGAGEAARR